MRTEKSLTRREFLQRSTLALAGSALASVVGACAPKTPTAPTATSAPAATPTAGPVTLEDFKLEVAPEAVDPLGIEKDVTVDGVFFQGGYGIEYIEHAADIFEALHPETDVSVEGIQRVGDHLRPRFISGNPPDVIDNSGAGNLDTVALVEEGKLLDLAPLMNAPSLDTPGKKFKDTLFPGSQDTGVFEGKQFYLNVAYTVVGIWHSSSLFEDKGWEYPKTWEDMLAFCEMVKQETDMSPWTYQGKYPGYMAWGLWYPLIYKIGGTQPIFNVDNLEPDCFKQPEVKQATEMMYELAEKDYIMPGTAGLTHTEAQAEWLKGKAVFIPCGSWLENEMKKVTPEGFDMVVKSVPAVSGGEGTYEGMMTSSGEVYFVPSEAKHPQCGVEYLRILLSKASASFFAEQVNSMMPVIGGTEEAALSPGMKSAVEAADAAGEETFRFPFYGGVSEVGTAVSNQMGKLLTKKITPDEFIEEMQKAADKALSDPEVEIIKRH